MNKKYLALVLVIIAVTGSIIWSNQPAKSPATSEAPIQTISIAGSNFIFSLTEITVKKGQPIKIVLTNTGTYPHDFVIDELGVRTSIIGPGETTEVAFTPDQAGEFEYYCSVGKHRAMGMVGKLIVE
ncbi:MAG: cupredoxin domain-containing protein [bacterium]|nr:cupredoxin domain-containing protein [bacterium]